MGNADTTWERCLQRPLSRYRGGRQTRTTYQCLTNNTVLAVVISICTISHQTSSLPIKKLSFHATMSDIEKGNLANNVQYIADSDNSRPLTVEEGRIEDANAPWWKKHWHAFLADFTETRGVQRVPPEARQPVSRTKDEKTLGSRKTGADCGLISHRLHSACTCR